MFRLQFKQRNKTKQHNPQNKRTKQNSNHTAQNTNKKKNPKANHTEKMLIGLKGWRE